VGEGFSSINVELRKRFDLYANVRPAQSFPNTKSRFASGVDLITVRENTEGAYGAEGQTLSPDGEQAQSLIRTTRRGCERIVRYAFDLARKQGRKKVTLVHKANIMKTTSGLFLKVAREVAAEYPRHPVQRDDRGQHLHAVGDAIRSSSTSSVTTNLFGDIISDLCAGLVGGLGLAPGANIGTEIGDLRSRARFGTRHRGQGHRQSLRTAAGRRPDAGATWGSEERQGRCACARHRRHAGCPRQHSPRTWVAAALP
jgi:isocitrate dehydrogenase (NAD+)